VKYFGCGRQAALGIAMGMALSGMSVQMGVQGARIFIVLDPASLHAVDFPGSPGQKIVFVIMPFTVPGSRFRVMFVTTDLVF